MDDFRIIYKILKSHKIVNETIYQESMKILEHRDGSPYEDMVVIDARTGSVLFRVTDANEIGKLSITHEQYDSIINYDGIIVLFHNHPNGSRPSYTDILKLKENNILSVVAVGHDGSVFEVSELNTQFDIEKFWNEAYNTCKEQCKDDILARNYATDALYRMDVIKVKKR